MPTVLADVPVDAALGSRRADVNPSDAIRTLAKQLLRDAIVLSEHAEAGDPCFALVRAAICFDFDEIEDQSTRAYLKQHSLSRAWARDLAYGALPHSDEHNPVPAPAAFRQALEVLS